MAPTVRNTKFSAGSMAPSGRSSTALNRANLAAPATETVKYIGVRKGPNRKRFSAEIRTKRYRIWLGVFHTAEHAAIAYDTVARWFRGNMTKTNFPVAIPVPELIMNSPRLKYAWWLSRQPEVALPPAAAADATAVAFPAAGRPLVTIAALPPAPAPVPVPAVPHGGAQPVARRRLPDLNQPYLDLNAPPAWDSDDDDTV